MKTVEALISCMVLLSFSSFFLLSASYPEQSLERYRLAEDIWRIYYLKGCFSQTEVLDVSNLGDVEGAINSTTFQNTEPVKDLITSHMPVTDPKIKMKGCILDVNNQLLDKYHNYNITVDFDTWDATTGNYQEGDIVLEKTIIVNGFPQKIRMMAGTQ